MTYIAFTETRDTGKTKVWSVDNTNDGSHLGEIKWRGGWRKYVLAIEPDTIWSSDCLRDVVDFMERQMAFRRGKVELRLIGAEELCICIDADCPGCGHPERVTPVSSPGSLFGCRKCDYVSVTRDK